MNGVLMASSYHNWTDCLKNIPNRKSRRAHQIFRFFISIGKYLLAFFLNSSNPTSFFQIPYDEPGELFERKKSLRQSDVPFQSSAILIKPLPRFEANFIATIGHFVSSITYKWTKMKNFLYSNLVLIILLDRPFQRFSCLF